MVGDDAKVFQGAIGPAISRHCDVWVFPMTQHISDLTKNAKTARRKPANEAWTLCTIGGGFSVILVFWLLLQFPRFQVPFGLTDIGFCFVAGAVLGAVIGSVYYPLARRVISRARIDHAAMLHQSQADTDAAMKQKIAEMKAKA